MFKAFLDCLYFQEEGYRGKMPFLSCIKGTYHQHDSSLLVTLDHLI